MSISLSLDYFEKMGWLSLRDGEAPSRRALLAMTGYLRHYRFWEILGVHKKRPLPASKNANYYARLLRTRVSSQICHLCRRGSFRACANLYACAVVFARKREILRTHGNLVAHAGPSSNARENYRECRTSCADAGVPRIRDLFCSRDILRTRGGAFLACATFCTRAGVFAHARASANARDTFSACAGICARAGIFAEARTSAHGTILPSLSELMCTRGIFLACANFCACAGVVSWLRKFLRSRELWCKRVHLRKRGSPHR